MYVLVKDLCHDMLRLLHNLTSLSDVCFLKWESQVCNGYISPVSLILPHTNYATL